VHLITAAPQRPEPRTGNRSEWPLHHPL